ncbi:MAG: glycosyltransferase family 4 protein [Anaerolineae bacterium]|nr:glycosyltransferase family 4 protein [Anaerolineae bacterium]
MLRWCRDVAELAQSKGYETTVYQRDVVTFERELSEGFKVVGVKCPSNWLGLWTYHRWFEKNTNPDDPCLYLTMELARFQKPRRAVAVQHGIGWEGDFPQYKKWLNRKLQPRLINKLRGVICVDTNYINWCHAEFPNRAEWERKLSYVPNYADPEFFRVMPNPPNVNGLPTILFPRRATGTSSPGKGRYGMLERSSRGAGLFLKAIAHLDRTGTPVRAIFSGKGPVQADILSWADEHGIADRVTVTEVELDEMPDLYAKANVVVVPTLEREGTSLTAIESIMCGIPTVVTYIGGLGNLVIDGVNGYMCDLSPESLAHGIRRALEARRLPTGPTLESFRENLGKPRWERQVWQRLSQWLELE